MPTRLQLYRTAKGKKAAKGAPAKQRRLKRVQQRSMVSREASQETPEVPACQPLGITSQNYKSRPKVFDQIYILIYPQASTPYKKYPAGVPQDPSSKSTMLRLIVATAIAFIPICDCWALRERDPKPQNGLAAVENGMMGIKGRLVPNTGDPPLDEDDGFELPPPAYELHDGVLGTRSGVSEGKCTAGRCGSYKG